MSVPTYNYEAHFQWEWSEQFTTTPDQNTLINQLKTDMESKLTTLFTQKLAAAASSSGHTYQVIGASTTMGDFSISGSTVNIGYVTPCETVIRFLLDVAGGGTLVVFNPSSSESQGALDGGIMTMLKIWIFDPTTGQTTQGQLSQGSNIGQVVVGIGLLAALCIGIYAVGR